jgi:hypothetical protein
MAFDLELAERVRRQLGQRPGLTEKKMFGGLSFLLNGNMCCGVYKQELLVRLDPGQTEQALSQPHTRIFDISSRPMKGWILVRQEGLALPADLAGWVQAGLDYAAGLPPK